MADLAEGTAYEATVERLEAAMDAIGYARPLPPSGVVDLAEALPTLTFPDGEGWPRFLDDVEDLLSAP